MMDKVASQQVAHGGHVHIPLNNVLAIKIRPDF